MSKGFNFNKIKRKYLPVTLKDGRTITVKMPQKQTFEKIGILQESEDENAAKMFKEIDVILSEALSNNLESIDINAAYIAEQFDLEEQLAFIGAFVEFVNEVQGDPN